jgi:phytoene/squalene synthetase
MTSTHDVMRVLSETSRTFCAPFVGLPNGHREAVASADLA